MFSACRCASRPQHEVRADVVQPEGVLPRGSPALTLPQLLPDGGGRAGRRRQGGPLLIVARVTRDRGATVTMCSGAMVIGIMMSRLPEKEMVAVRDGGQCLDYVYSCHSYRVRWCYGDHVLWCFGYHVNWCHTLCV